MNSPEIAPAGPTHLKIAGFLGKCDVEIDLAPGACTFFHGPNGCGKSTLLRLVWHLLSGDMVFNSATARSVTLTYADGNRALLCTADAPTVGYPHDHLPLPARQVVLLPDHWPTGRPYAPPCRRPIEVVPPGKNGVLLTGVSDENMALAVYPYSYLLTRTNRAYHDLSAGEQRLAALLDCNGRHSYAVLIVDEPEQSLHPDLQRELVAALKEQNPTNTLIFATHSPAIVASRHSAGVQLPE
jgi:energy-coupling factor transporter ATP-binding protein EcfA2